MVYGYITAPKAGKVVPSEITLRPGTKHLAYRELHCGLWMALQLLFHAGND
jgi:hypothetical protein